MFLRHNQHQSDFPRVPSSLIGHSKAIGELVERHIRFHPDLTGIAGKEDAVRHAVTAYDILYF